MRGAARAREAVVPDWLAEIARLRRGVVPWADMVRAGIASGGPLAVAFAVGQRGPGELIAMGGLLGTLVDKGAPYAARVKRVGSAAVFGGAAGLTIGSFIHGRGWIAVVALVGVAGGSPPLSAVGDLRSVARLPLLIYTSLCLGPLLALRPLWPPAPGFLLRAPWGR